MQPNSNHLWLLKWFYPLFKQNHWLHQRQELPLLWIMVLQWTMTIAFPLDGLLSDSWLQSDCAPFCSSYYRGSQKFTTIDFSAMEAEDESASDYSSSSIAAESSSGHKADMSLIKEKSSGNGCTNFIHGLLHYRIPRTEKSLLHVILAFFFVSANIACLFTYDNLASGNNNSSSRSYLQLAAFGSLAAANSLLVAIPATRNSLLAMTLGIPFDKTIMFHRWLGRFVILLVTIHMVWELTLWGMSSVELMAEQLLILSNIWGLAGWAVGIFILVTSMEYFRR